MANIKMNKKIVISRVASVDTSGNASVVEQYLPATVIDSVRTDETLNTTFVEDLKQNPENYVPAATEELAGLISKEDKNHLDDIYKINSTIEVTTNKIHSLDANADGTHYVDALVMKNEFEKQEAALSGKLDRIILDYGEGKTGIRIEPTKIDYGVSGTGGKSGIKFKTDGTLISADDQDSYINGDKIIVVDDLVDPTKVADKAIANAKTAKDNINAFIATKGKIDGPAPINDKGYIDDVYLPESADEVRTYDYFDEAEAKEHGSNSFFPAEGEAGIIYILAIGNGSDPSSSHKSNTIWRWGGSAYAQLSASLSLGTVQGTAYYGHLGAENRANIAENARLLKEENLVAYNNAKTDADTNGQNLKIAQDKADANDTALAANGTEISNVDGINTETGLILGTQNENVDGAKTSTADIEKKVEDLQKKIQPVFNNRVDKDDVANDIQEVSGTVDEEKNIISTLSKDTSDPHKINFTMGKVLTPADGVNFVHGPNSSTKYAIARYADENGKNLLNSAGATIASTKDGDWSVNLENIDNKNNTVYNTTKINFVDGAKPENNFVLNYDKTSFIRNETNIDFFYSNGTYENAPGEFKLEDVNVDDIFFAMVK